MDIAQVRSSYLTKNLKSIHKEAKGLEISGPKDKNKLIELIIAKKAANIEFGPFNKLLIRWTDAKNSEKTVKREICVFIYLSIKQLNLGITWKQIKEDKKNTVKVNTIYFSLLIVQ